MSILARLWTGIARCIKALEGMDDPIGDYKPTCGAARQYGMRGQAATLELDPETATALKDPATRARVERLVTRMVRPANPARLFDAIRALKADAHSRGLTDAIIDEELAAYNAERRGRPPTA